MYVFAEIFHLVYKFCNFGLDACEAIIKDALMKDVKTGRKNKNLNTDLTEL